MRIDRLERLIHVLENIPETGKFNLTHWYQPNECGTTACAFGWAALDEEFQRQGLSTFAAVENDGTIRGYSVKFKDYYSVEAAREFFEITRETTVHLFMPGSYEISNLNNPQAVIERIKKLIDKERGTVHITDSSEPMKVIEVKKTKTLETV